VATATYTYPCVTTAQLPVYLHATSLVYTGILLVFKNTSAGTWSAGGPGWSWQDLLPDHPVPHADHVPADV